MKENKKRVNIWAVAYGVFLVLFTVIALVDAFVVPKEVVEMEEVKKYENPFLSVETTTEKKEMSTEETEPEESTSVTVEDNTEEIMQETQMETKPETEEVTETETTTEAVTEQATTEPETEKITQPEETTKKEEPVITENSYSCEKFTITISKEHIYETDVYIADVVMKDVSYLKAGLADGKFGRNVKHKTSTIAADCGAILAVNGDYYGFREKGFVMRNGYLYRTTARNEANNDALVVSYDGTMKVVDERESNAEQLAENGAFHIFTFGPGLIENGVNVAEENSVAEHASVHNPRTAIGMIAPMHYILVVCDGRTSQSRGLTLAELADVMSQKGCTTAYNLDGGGSATMYFMGEVVNWPTTDGEEFHERRVSDIVYIGE